jgi:hypothetical protein
MVSEAWVCGRVRAPAWLRSDGWRLGRELWRLRAGRVCARWIRDGAGHRRCGQLCDGVAIHKA